MIAATTAIKPEWKVLYDEGLRIVTENTTIPPTVLFQNGPITVISTEGAKGLYRVKLRVQTAPNQPESRIVSFYRGKSKLEAVEIHETEGLFTGNELKIPIILADLTEQSVDSLS